jgi:hypothetical protein
MSEPKPRKGISERKLYVWLMVVGVGLGGVAFVFKIMEFLRTLESPDAEGFVVVPITTYFVVATGYLFLLGWAWASGQMKRLEEPKYDMLARELDYERLEKDGVQI